VKLDKSLDFPTNLPENRRGGSKATVPVCKVALHLAGRNGLGIRNNHQLRHGTATASKSAMKIRPPGQNWFLWLLVIDLNKLGFSAL
jgi:hypothetical protein